MKQVIILAAVLFTACTKSPETSEKQSQVIKPGYSVEIVNNFTAELNSIDSLKPSFIETLEPNQQLLGQLTEAEKQEHKPEINAVKANHVIATFYDYMGILLDKKSEVRRTAYGVLTGSDYDNIEVKVAEYIAKNDTVYYCAGTEKKLKEIKDKYIERYK